MQRLVTELVRQPAASPFYFEIASTVHKWLQVSLTHRAPGVSFAYKYTWPEVTGQAGSTHLQYDIYP